jgi:hypothetical protein
VGATGLGLPCRPAVQGEPLLEAGSLGCKVVLEEYLRCRGATWGSRDMLELIRLRSQVGEAGSPSEGPSTSAASTPKGAPGRGGSAGWWLWGRV